MVEGPDLEWKYKSFIGYHDIPVSHGMTVGELAELYNAERRIGASLEVIRMENWNRRLFFDQTGLPWVNPSPNIRNVREAAIYPGIGFLEDLPLSVGRGTDSPFEVIGAPWVDGRSLARNLNLRRLPGVSFVPTKFTPRKSVFRGRLCGGVQILLWDRRIFRPTGMGIHVVSALLELYPNRYRTRITSALAPHIGNDSVPESLVHGIDPDVIIASWSKAVDDWYTRRRPYLLYQ